jgi:hypothetical protein
MRLRILMKFAQCVNFYELASRPLIIASQVL